MNKELQKNETSSLARIRPSTDILEKEDGFHILMDLPGVEKQDMVIDLDDNALTIKGKTSYPAPANEKLVDTEFGNVEFLRKFTLSDAVDKQSIQANLNAGVLELYLPKAEEAKPKRIEIQSG